MSKITKIRRTPTSVLVGIPAEYRKNLEGCNYFTCKMDSEGIHFKPVRIK